MFIEDGIDNLIAILHRQLDSHWMNYDFSVIEGTVNEALRLLEAGMSDLSEECKYVWDNKGEIYFSPYNTVEYSIFLYRLSHLLYCKDHEREATLVYYLNKIMHSVDWFYAIELPRHFWADHPMGCVLGRAKYGDRLYVTQGVTVGGNTVVSLEDIYPIIGDNVMLCANSSIIGNCRIGNDVVLAIGATVRNQNIPDGSIVFGNSPDLTIKEINSRIRKNIGVLWNTDV